MTKNFGKTSSQRLQSPKRKVRIRRDILSSPPKGACAARASPTTITHAHVSIHPDAIRRRKRAEERKKMRSLEESLSMSMAGGADVISDALCDRHQLENVKCVENVKDLLKEIRNASNRGRAKDELSGLSRLAILAYQAPWCRACRAVHAKLLKLAEEHPRVLFISVDASKSEDIISALSVDKLPCLHFYDASRGIFRCDTVSVKPEKIEALKQTINHYDVPKCDIQYPLLPERLLESINHQKGSTRCR